MSLLSLIEDGTKALADKSNELKSNMDNLYSESPFGALENSMSDISDRFNNSGIHQAFAGGKYGSGIQGSASVPMGLEPLASNYVDATGQMRSVMADAGMSISSMANLQGGPQMADLKPHSFEAGSPILPVLTQADRDNAILDDVTSESAPPPIVDTAYTPALLEEDETPNGVLAE